MNATFRAIALIALPCLLATACSQARAEPPAPATAAALAAPSAPTPECKGGPDVQDDDTRVDIQVGAAPTRGAADAPVTVVVFADFECPFCARTTPLLEELEAAHAGKVRVVFKNKPLPFHTSARLAAKAALAAGEQGKFWPMHDLLVQNTGALRRADLERYAVAIGLDSDRFRTGLDDPRLDARVDADIREADAAGVKGTPTAFVNDRRITGARGKEHFTKVIDDELRAR